jgi:hydrogenase nickel incorporation protein HypB
MCEHCGCGDPHAHEHGHDHDHDHEHGNAIPVGEDLFAHDRAHAESLRERLRAQDARMVNIIGSPGCGKTELLSKLIAPWKAKASGSCVVVEGDLATDNDAKRISAAGAPVHQIQTGTVCHLTAHDVEHAVLHLPVGPKTLVLVENVGNLVCPSLFDLGEALRIVCLSVTEGADKPLKYPVAFRNAGLVVLTKKDLLPHVDFDVEDCLRMIREIRPGTPVLTTSARTGEGIEELVATLGRLWS